MKTLLNRVRNVQRAKRIARAREIQQANEWIDAIRRSALSKFI